MLTAKRRAKIEKLLTEIRSRHPHGACWVCGTHRGMKTSRASYGLRCRKCFEGGRTIPDVGLFEQCSAEIELGHKPRDHAAG